MPRASDSPSRLLAGARVLEWAASRLCRAKSGAAGGGFCATLWDRDPVNRAIHLLRERLDEPLDPTAIAKEVGVAPHHLSRREPENMENKGDIRVLLAVFLFCWLWRPESLAVVAGRVETANTFLALSEHITGVLNTLIASLQLLG